MPCRWFTCNITVHRQYTHDYEGVRKILHSVLTYSMEDKHKLAGCCGCVIFITSIVLVACSFATIDVNDVCLKYGTITREVSKTIIQI
jgi:hypothetical protein